jgi:hypothetical protein
MTRNVHHVVNVNKRCAIKVQAGATTHHSLAVSAMIIILILNKTLASRDTVLVHVQTATAIMEMEKMEHA